MSNKKGRLLTLLAVTAATIVGTVIVGSKAADKHEEEFFADHAENGGLDLGLNFMPELQDDEELIFVKPVSSEQPVTQQADTAEETDLPEEDTDAETEIGIAESEESQPKRGLASIFVGTDDTVAGLEQEDYPEEDFPEIEEPENDEDYYSREHTVFVGQTLVSDDRDNQILNAVSEATGIPVGRLLLLAAESMMMCLEFSDENLRIPATLRNVYFINGNEISMPPDEERDNVLAFGKEFIDSVPELADFLA